MIIGKVVGSVVSTRKNENLVGNKFMIVEFSESKDSQKKKIVAIDNIGAGVGEVVLVTTGSAARVGLNNIPVDAAIVGIVDSCSELEI
jgi:ethanolamine utilization protein EutN